MIKPRKKVQKDRAVALRYSEAQHGAPTVVAKGEGLVAQKIRELAESHGIPVERDDVLVELLEQVDIDREIPPELYASVAELLCWIYRANDEIRKGLLKQ
jgi:flagellar biosynthesis protein